MFFVPMYIFVFVVLRRKLLPLNERQYTCRVSSRLIDLIVLQGATCPSNSNYRHRPVVYPTVWKTAEFKCDRSLSSSSFSREFQDDNEAGETKAAFFQANLYIGYGLNKKKKGQRSKK